MQTRNSRVYEIDGQRFSTLEDFYTEVSRVVIPGADWGHNLDAFNDILRGGFGTPEGGFTVRRLQLPSRRYDWGTQRQSVSWNCGSPVAIRQIGHKWRKRVRVLEPDGVQLSLIGWWKSSETTGLVVSRPATAWSSCLRRPHNRPLERTGCAGRSTPR